jgi:hypothetical protein
MNHVCCNRQCLWLCVLLVVGALWLYCSQTAVMVAPAMIQFADVPFPAILMSKPVIGQSPAHGLAEVYRGL